jgi:hypothetical protein
MTVNFRNANYKNALSLKPYAFSLMNQFVDQHPDTIEKGGHENSFGSLIAVGIDIDGKQDGVGQQGNAADGRKQLFVRMEYVKIFTEADGPAKNPEIIEGHRQQGTEYTQENADF